MANVVSVSTVGSAYHNGRRCPGWGTFTLDNGHTETVGESMAYIDSVLNEADKQGHNTARYRERLDLWVKTGNMPVN